MEELAEFLNDHYVESSDGSFRLAYTKEFLRWQYMKPGYNSEYQLAIRNSKNGKIMATIMC